LPEFSQTCPKKTDLQKKALHVNSGAIFQMKACWAPFLLIFSESLGRFTEIFPGFQRIFPGCYWFFPEFSPNQNFWGCGCTSCTPASYTSVDHYLETKQLSIRKQALSRRKTTRPAGQEEKSYSQYTRRRFCNFQQTWRTHQHPIGISGRIMMVKLNRPVPLNIVCANALTLPSSVETKDAFYDSLPQG